MSNRPVEFAGLLSKALARKANDTVNASSGIVEVNFSVAPAGMFLPLDQVRGDWARKYGFTLAPDPTPVGLRLVEPSSADNEIEFGGDDDDDAA